MILEISMQFHDVFLEMLEEGIIPIGKGSNTELRESLKYEGNFIEDEKELDDLANRIREGQSATDNLYNPEAFHIEEWKKDIIYSFHFYHLSSSVMCILYIFPNKCLVEG